MRQDAQVTSAIPRGITIGELGKSAKTADITGKPLLGPSQYGSMTKVSLFEAYILNMIIKNVYTFVERTTRVD
jgi:hypothetical protein